MSPATGTAAATPASTSAPGTATSQLVYRRSYGDFCIACGAQPEAFTSWLPPVPGALQELEVVGGGLAARLRGTSDFFARHVARDPHTGRTVLVLGTPLRRADHAAVRPAELLAGRLDARRGSELWGQFTIVRLDPTAGRADWLLDLERSLSPWWTDTGMARVALRFAPRPSRTGAQLDAVGAGEFLVHGIVGRERTPVRGWLLMPAAHAVRWEPGRPPAAEAYPHPVHDTPAATSDPYQDLARRLADTVAQAVAPFRAALLPLTGGIDSRLLLGALLHGRVPFEAYTHGTPGCADHQTVERYKQRFAFPHRFHAILPEQQAQFRDRALASLQSLGPEYDYLAYPHLLTSYAAEDPTERLFLSGVGTGLHKIPYLPQVAHAWSRKPLVDAVVQHYGRLENLALLHPAVAAGAVEQMRAAIAACLDECPPGTARVHRIQYYHLQERLGRWAGKGMQLQDLCGFDIAYPFLAPDLMRTSRHLDYARLHLGQKIIRALEILEPRLLHVDNANGWPCVRLSVRAVLHHVPAYWRGWSRYVYRKTHGRVAANIAIVDYRQVYAGAYRDWVTDLLDPAASHLGQIVRPEALAALRDDLQRGTAAPRRLGALAALEIWARS
jgi:hypothetical protein